ncbi:thiamine diphosphokinase [Jannaschia pohangensis]|uniref:Thiamine diphosphokinase n=1 Tax=Jannaschia pohangensis TaxID=390807 RepID=A0A1I3N6D8_9RHOB|nr:thiamine diphosphokinase [Jannaschia pohangensis]
MPDSKQLSLNDTIPQTLVGGVPVSRTTLDEALSHAPRLIAADGGADTALAFDLVPDLVIGDLDSISAAAREAFSDRLCHLAEQDSTDFAKALRTCPASLTIGVGFIGARVDHFLANLTEIARNGANCILLGDDDCLCVCLDDMQLDLEAGTRVSLWPLGPVTGTSTGLRWPIDGIAMSPTTRVGTSNEALGPVTLTLSGGPMVLILPATALTVLLKSLDSAPRPRASAPL